MQAGCLNGKIDNNRRKKARRRNLRARLKKRRAAIMASALLIKGETVLHNVPNLSDVEASANILRRLGARVERKASTLIIDASSVTGNTIPEEMMREMRSSIIFLGSLLSRCGEAWLCPPGGCDIGIRPIDLHISSLKKLGAPNH